MTFVSKAALAAMLGLGATLVVAPPADAQKRKKEEAAPAGPQVSEAFRTADLAADAAVRAAVVGHVIELVDQEADAR